MRYFLELSYNGKAYHGWQNQPNAISVQEVLEEALSKLLRDQINIVGAGRTDTGVHAQQMYAHFDTENHFENNDLLHKLNSFLPKDIAVHQIYNVSRDAHARFDALSRTYIYRIATQKDAFSFDNAYYIKFDLDIELMNKGAKVLYDYRNFKCFSRAHTDVKTYNCDISLAEWHKEGRELVFTITADRFLRNMVRAIVGTLLEIGSGKTNVGELHEVIKSENRSRAGASVPAHGLYLYRIEYPKHIFS